MKYYKNDLDSIESNHFKKLKEEVLRKLKKEEIRFTKITSAKYVDQREDLKKKFNMVISKSYRSKYGNRKRNRRFMDIKRVLLEQNAYFMANYEKILRAQKDDFVKLIHEYETKFSCVVYKKLLDNRAAYYFSYTDFKNDSTYNNKMLIKKLGIRVCPYCNRQYVIGLDEGAKNAVSPHLDHYYCQKKWPMFGISFYNLIPSCQYCNQLKSTQDTISQPHFHPYFDKDEPYFEVVLSDNIENFKSVQDLISYKISGINQKLLLDTEKAFSLTDMYNNHKIEFDDIVGKYLIYTPERIEKIKELLEETSHNHFGLGTYDIEKHIFDLPEPGEHGVKPLDKFRSDIYDGLKLLKYESKTKSNLGK